MDIRFHTIYSRIRSALSKRFPKRFKRSTSASSNFKNPWIRIGGIGLLAIWLGIQANESASGYAVRQWESNHRPSPETWNRLLDSHSFEEITSPADQDRVLRKLGTPTDRDGTVWIGVGDNAIEWVVYFSQRAGGRVTLYSRGNLGQLPDSKNWHRLGSGWGAFETVSNGLGEPTHLKEKEIPPKSERKRPKKRAPVDPREIRY